MTYRLDLIFIVLVLSIATVWAEALLPVVKLDNPRDTMRSFMEAMDDYKEGVKKNDKRLKSRLDDAGRCLNFSREVFGVAIPLSMRRETAIFLKEFIDRVIVIDYTKIPTELAPGRYYWRLKDTEIEIAANKIGKFLFTPQTGEQAKRFYQRVKDHPYKKGSGGGAYYQTPWLEKYIPDWARDELLFSPNWQWIGMLLAIVLGLILRKLIESLTQLLQKMTRKTRVQWDDKIVAALNKPAGLLIASLFWLLSIHLLRLDGLFSAILTVIAQVLFGLSLIWALYRLSDVAANYLQQFFAERTDSFLDENLVVLLQKILKISALFLGFLALLQNFGVNIMSVLAGLGLGGLALALAAKDTCANFFGSIMIFLDRPFRIGDWIIVDQFEGTVTEIGFRSTRVRTFYDSVITIPNAIVANAHIDNMGSRTYRRIKAMIGLTYDTPPEKIEAFLEGIKNIIRANEHTRKDYFHVVFHSYGNFSLNILLYCFLKVPNWATELVERQRIYLEILRLAESLDINFAFPTRTLHVDSFPGQEQVEDAQRIDAKTLRQKASSFGPNGSDAKAEGLGIFMPPYEETHDNTRKY